MSLEQFYFVSQIVASVALVTSLIFVGFQLRQNTNSMKISAAQTHATNYQHIVSVIVGSGEMARIWRLGLADLGALNDDDRVRFIVTTTNMVRAWEASFSGWRRGQLDAEHWHFIEQQATDFVQHSGCQAFWKVRRHWFLPEFQQWIESMFRVSGHASPY